MRSERAITNAELPFRTLRVGVHRSLQFSEHAVALVMCIEKHPSIRVYYEKREEVSQN